MKFSFRFSQLIILNKTGWTVTSPLDGMTMNKEGGEAVWERFEELNIECDY